MRFEHLMTYRNKDQSGWTSFSFVHEPKEKLLMTANTYETFILRGFRKSYLVRVPMIVCLECDLHMRYSLNCMNCVPKKYRKCICKEARSGQK
jgi:hypothetical protein